MELPSGIQNSLTERLLNVIDSINAEALQDAVNQLNAFINSVEAQAGKKIPNEQATDLITQAQSIIQSIEI